MSILKRVIPLFDHVLVQLMKPPQKTGGGILLPESAQRRTNEAQVVAVGRGTRNVEGKFTPLVVAVGDTVLLPAGEKGDEIKVNGEDFIMIREEKILAKIEQKARGKVSSDVPDMRNLPT